MSKTNLKIYAKFPTWDGLSEPVKSLINFFMKNASVVFRGEYRDSSFQYMSGNVRNKCYSSFDETEEYWNYSLELNIAYFPFDPSEEYNVVDGFPDGSSTVAPLTSSLELLELTEDGTYTETDLLSGGIPIPVILTPKSGDTVINNPRLKPKDIKTNYHHIVEIPIETDGLDFMYDFQLRSSSFYIDDGEGGIGHPAFLAYRKGLDDGGNTFVDVYLVGDHRAKNLGGEGGKNACLHTAAQTVGQHQCGVLSIDATLDMVAAQFLPNMVE